ncbi:hypothetical protein [Candidatus Nitrososphaera evergladensis]|uniref:Vgb family protein n=1 Tax=Candidatus Nitrososphaera evergladensis TaxID=1459637 RepID=UPI0011E60066|nr:hypothetical protein [Candidatus Nitrososphaera evergladensis]
MVAPALAVAVLLLAVLPFQVVNAQTVTTGNDDVTYTKESKFIKEFQINDLKEDRGLGGITTDARGMPWFYFSTNATSAVFSFDPSGNKFTRYDVQGETVVDNPVIKLAAGQLVFDREGALWFTDARTNSIGRLANGQIQLIPIPTEKSGPMGIALSPDGGSVWFAEILGNKIGKVDTASAKITAEYSLPEQSGPTFLDFDDSGALWVSLSYSRSVMRIEPWLLASSSAAGMPILSLPKPDSFSPFGIAVANNGKLYLSDHGSSRVIVSDATLQNYTSYWTSPSGSFPATLPSQIVSDDKSGNVYFPEHGGNRIARIDSQGVMTEYEIPTGPLSAAVFAAVSHDGKKVWFTEWASNKVAYLDASAQVPFDAQILQPQQSITLTKSGAASLDVLIKKSAIANGSDNSLGSLSLSQVEVGLTGMTESGLAGVTYHANPPRVNLQENASSSSAESNIQLQARITPSPAIIPRWSRFRLLRRTMTA